MWLDRPWPIYVLESGRGRLQLDAVGTRVTTYDNIVSISNALIWLNLFHVRANYFIFLMFSSADFITMFRDLYFACDRDRKPTNKLLIFYYKKEIKSHICAYCLFIVPIPSFLEKIIPT